MLPQKTPLDDIPQPLIAHLEEIRKRLMFIAFGFFASFSVAYLFKESILYYLTCPLSTHNQESELIYTHLAEPFLTYLKLSFFVAFCVTFPWGLTQIWRFVAPGLYRDEKKFTRFLFLASPVLFAIGLAFAYFFILPNAWSFFLSFQLTGEGGMNLSLKAKISEYLNLTTQILFAFGVSFQLPLLILGLGKLGLVTSKMLLKGRRYALLIIMIVSAFLTPPDVLSMLGLTAPLYMLYEISARILKHLEDI